MKKHRQEIIAILLVFVEVAPTILCIGIGIPLGTSDGWEKLDDIAIPEDKPYILGDWTGIDRASSHKPGGFLLRIESSELNTHQ